MLQETGPLSLHRRTAIVFGLLGSLTFSAPDTAVGQGSACDLAVPLVIGVPENGMTPSGPSPDPNALDCGTAVYTGGSGAWHTVIGTGNVMTVSTCNTADFDTQIMVYLPCNDCEQLVCVGGNDDGVGCAGSTSIVSWESIPGGDYKIYVTGVGGATGNFTIIATDGGTAAPGALVCPTRIICNHVPPPWQVLEVPWNRDVAPRNKVDDLIDASNDSQFNVLVNYRRCIDDDDVQTLEDLSTTSIVQARLKYLPSVAVSDLTFDEVLDIASFPEVAFIERQLEGEYYLDESVPTTCATDNSVSCAGSARSTFGANGAGTTVVIMDCGVDNGHASLQNTTVVAGFTVENYPASVDMVDEDDSCLAIFPASGHGTHVASTALGQATPNQGEGVAPAARLVDAKIGLPNDFHLAATKALEIVYDNRDTWRVDVINMSFGLSGSTNGLDAFSQLVDLAESMDIVVVAAAGNAGANILVSPGAATRSITVASSHDLGDVDRSNDVISSYSNFGPRTDDGDADQLDELKPEVTAPGENILAARSGTASGAAEIDGTSMAAPHVAGLAALIRQVRPGINAASVKDLIISTAELPAGAPPSVPGVDPTWNRNWGWGLINAFEALNTLLETDLSYPSHPANPSWLSPDITTSPFPPKVNVPTTVIVDIENTGPNTAFSARIHFGVHVYSASTPVFHDIGTKVVDLPPGHTVVTIPWVPVDVNHQCLKVEIGYGPDTDYSNNTAQRNVTVVQSPVSFAVANTRLPGPALIEFETTFAANPNPPWTVDVIPSAVVLEPSDCPEEIVVDLIRPAGHVVGEPQLVHVAAILRSPSAPPHRGELVGGVSVVDFGFTSSEECEGFRRLECRRLPAGEQAICEACAERTCRELFAPVAPAPPRSARPSGSPGPLALLCHEFFGVEAVLDPRSPAPPTSTVSLAVKALDLHPAVRRHQRLARPEPAESAPPD